MSDNKDTYHDNVFDEIKEKASLVDEMEKHGVSFQRCGRGKLKCNCPFHEEKSPSCIVYLDDDPETYHCFGCGVHGTIIDFVMDFNNYKRGQTLEYFKENYNIIFDAKSLERINVSRYRNKNTYPIFAKTLLIADDIRDFLSKSINPFGDFEKIKEYMKNLDEAISAKDQSFIDIFEKSMLDSLNVIHRNDKLYQMKLECDNCNECSLRKECDAPIFGYGSSFSDIFFIREKNTVAESENKKNYSDKAGLLIKNIIDNQKIEIQKNIFLTKCTCCHGDPEDKSFCSKLHLKKQSDLMKPKKIMIFGEKVKDILFPDLHNIKLGDKSKVDFFGNKVEMIFNIDPEKIIEDGGKSSELYDDFKSSIIKLILEA